MSYFLSLTLIGTFMPGHIQLSGPIDGLRASSFVCTGGSTLKHKGNGKNISNSSHFVAARQHSFPMEEKGQMVDSQGLGADRSLWTCASRDRLPRILLCMSI